MTVARPAHHIVMVSRALHVTSLRFMTLAFALPPPCYRPTYEPVLKAHRCLAAVMLWSSACLAWSPWHGKTTGNTGEKTLTQQTKACGHRQQDLSLLLTSDVLQSSSGIVPQSSGDTDNQVVPIRAWPEDANMYRLLVSVWPFIRRSKGD